MAARCGKPNSPKGAAAPVRATRAIQRTARRVGRCSTGASGRDEAGEHARRQAPHHQRAGHGHRQEVGRHGGQREAAEHGNRTGATPIWAAIVTASASPAPGPGQAGRQRRGQEGDAGGGADGEPPADRPHQQRVDQDHDGDGQGQQPDRARRPASTPRGGQGRHGAGPQHRRLEAGEQRNHATRPDGGDEPPAQDSRRSNGPANANM